MLSGLRTLTLSRGNNLMASIATFRHRSSLTMPDKLVVGIDVGDTNTDAVILKSDSDEVIASIKHLTTPDRTTGIRNAIANVIENLVQSQIGQSQYKNRDNVIKCIKRVNIGTTHFVNALIEQKKLQKVGVVRLCGPASRALPPFTDFPEDLRRALDGGCALVQGGYEFTGNEISSIDQQEIVQNAQHLWSNGVRNFVISGIFSTMFQGHETQASEIIRKVFPDASITLSHFVSYMLNFVSVSLIKINKFNYVI